MTITISEYIPAHKLGQFHEVLCATGGRYLSDPWTLGDRVHVYYEPGDYAAHQAAWRRCITEVHEIRKDQWWRTWLRRLGLKF